MSEYFEWPQIQLNRLIELINGFAFPSEGFTNDDGVPLIRIRDLGSRKTEVNFSGSYSVRYVVKNGDLLIGMDGDFSTVVWKGQESLLNQRVCRLVSKSDEFLNQRFLYYKIIEEIENIHNKTAATTVKHLSSKDVLAIGFELPSIFEQSKIAEILSSVDQAIEQTEALIAKQQRIKTGLMQDLLTRGIDEHGQLRTEQTHAFKDSPLGRIPVEWEVARLGEVADISAGVTLGKSYEGPDTVELPYLRVANVQDGYLDLSEIKSIRVPQNHLEKYALKVGDVLMNEGGDFDKLGRGAMWRGQVPVCLHQNHVFKVRPHNEKLASDFLAAVSASPYGKSFFMMASKQSTNLASINSTQLKAFPIPLPDYQEQIRIQTQFNRLAEVLNGSTAELKKQRSLKAALMQDLLTGRKRVTDLLEPATA